MNNSKDPDELPDFSYLEKQPFETRLQKSSTNLKNAWNELINSILDVFHIEHKNHGK